MRALCIRSGSRVGIPAKTTIFALEQLSPNWAILRRRMREVCRLIGTAMVQ